MVEELQFIYIFSARPGGVALDDQAVTLGSGSSNTKMVESYLNLRDHTTQSKLSGCGNPHRTVIKVRLSWYHLPYTAELNVISVHLY